MYIFPHKCPWELHNDVNAFGYATFKVVTSDENLFQNDPIIAEFWPLHLQSVENFSSFGHFGFSIQLHLHQGNDTFG